MNLARTRKIAAAALAVLMVLSFMPMTQENAFAAKKAKKPAKVKSVKVTVAKNNKVTVTWKKAKNAKMYNVSIKDGSSKLTSVKTSKKLKVTFQGGNKVKYTIKVQGVNGKKKGAFSKAVSKKTNDLIKAAKEELAKAEADKKAAEEALAQAEADKQAAQEALAQAEADKQKAEQDLADAIARAEEAEGQIADREVIDDVINAWDELSEITIDSSDADIAAAKAVIDAFDELTDEQKATIPKAVKKEMEKSRQLIAELEEAETKAAKARVDVKAAELYGTVTIDEKDYVVFSKSETEAKLICKAGIAKEFDKDSGIDWADSSLRAYLNSEYLTDNLIIKKLAKKCEHSYKVITSTGVYDELNMEWNYTDETEEKTATDQVMIISEDTVSAIPNDRPDRFRNRVLPKHDEGLMWTDTARIRQHEEEGTPVIEYSKVTVMNRTVSNMAESNAKEGEDGQGTAELKAFPVIVVDISE